MCETLFLGWDAPLLSNAVEYLMGNSAGHLDLSDRVCVLPSSFAVARLRQRLQQRATESQLELRLPRIVTTGAIAAQLYTADGTEATEFEQTLAWARVLLRTPGEKLEALIPNLPSTEAIGTWLEFAAMLRRLHTDLAANLYRFRDVLAESAAPADQVRWTLLESLHADYLAELATAGVSDPHVARLAAVRNQACRTRRQIVLIGTADLSELQAAMLLQAGASVTALVAAPPDQARLFDPLGCVQTREWLDHQLPIQDSQLVPATDISDQAVATSSLLVEFSRDIPTDKITIGVTDESQVAPLEMQLRHTVVDSDSGTQSAGAENTADTDTGISTHRHLGWTVAETAVGRLLALTTTYVQRRTWSSLAALVRHADVYRYVSQQLTASDSGRRSGRWLPQLDQMLANHFPIRVGDALSIQATEQYPLAIEVADCVEDWLVEFKSQQKVSFGDWNAVIAQWLLTLYPDAAAGGPEPTDFAANAESGEINDADLSVLPAERPTRTQLAATHVVALVERFRTLNSHLDVKVDGATALELLTARLGELRFNQPASDGCVNLLGWLDLMLDDSEALIVVGLNHPFVPESVSSDPYLPSNVRNKLRLAMNDRRYARDVYAMQLMITTRTQTRFIVGRSSADGTPTPPTRLIAAAQPQDVARRVSRLLNDERGPSVVTHRWESGPAETAISIPTLPTAAPVTVMSVTSFRDYLACPYRYFLRHVLKQKPIDDSARELAANQFGDLVHGAVESFGESADKDEPDPQRIEEGLIQHLHEYAGRVYGDQAAVAVRLQVAQAEQRLRHVAKAQAQRVEEGWVTHAVEAGVDEKSVDDQGNPKTPAGIAVDGNWMGLRGRFDRIDHHPATGRWAVLDFKTHGHKPEKKHLKGKGADAKWVDLQLPLYRMMIPFLGINADPDDVQLGYFNVSQKESETGIHLAEFSPQQFQSADDLIFDCVRRITAGDFAPSADRVDFDDYGMILQTGIASSLMDSFSASAEEGVSE